MHVGSALIVAAILIGGSVRVALLFRQGKPFSSNSRRQFPSSCGSS